MNAVQGEYSEDEIMRFFLIFMPIVNLQFKTTKRKGNIFFNLRRKRRIKKGQNHYFKAMKIAQIGPIKIKSIVTIIVGLLFQIVL